MKGRLLVILSTSLKQKSVERWDTIPDISHCDYDHIKDNLYKFKWTWLWKIHSNAADFSERYKSTNSRFLLFCLLFLPINCRTWKGSWSWSGSRLVLAADAGIPVIYKKHNLDGASTISPRLCILHWTVSSTCRHINIACSVFILPDNLSACIFIIYTRKSSLLLDLQTIMTSLDHELKFIVRLDYYIAKLLTP